MVQRLHPHPYLALFNGPDTSVTTAVRDSSTVALQALYLLNNPFVHDQSRRFAGQLLAAEPDPSARLRLAYLRAFGRAPTEAEARQGAARSWRNTSGAWPTRACPPTAARARPGPAWPGPCSPRTSSSTWIDRDDRPTGVPRHGRRPAEPQVPPPPRLGLRHGRRAGALSPALDRRRGELGPPARAPAGPLPGAGEAPDRLLHDGRDLAPRHVRLQAEASERPRQAGRQAQGAGLAVQVPPAGRVAARWSASCSSTSAGSSTSSASCTRSTATRPGTRPRPWACTPARSRSRCRASARGSATAWARSTRTCRRSSCSRPRSRTTATRSGTRTSCPPITRACGVIPGPDPLPDVKSPVASVTRRELEGRMLRDLNEAHLSARDGDAALASRMTTFDTAYGLMREAPEAFDIGRESRHDPRPLRRRGRRPRLVRRPVPRRPPAGRAGRAGGRAVRRRLEHELGQPQQHRRPPRPVAQHRSAHRRTGDRPETARAARRDPDRRLLRVRPHALARPDPARPRPPQPLLHLLPRRRRREGRDSATASPTSTATAPPRTPCTSTTSTPPSCT